MKGCLHKINIVILCVLLCSCGRRDERHFELAMRHKESGDYDRAIAELQAALEANPSYARAHNQLGIIYTRVGLYEKAADQCNQAAEFDEDFVGAYYNLGVLYHSHLNKPVEAVSAYKRYLELKPTGKRADAVRRIVQELLRQPMVRTAIEETPSVRFEVASSYEARGEYSEAIEEYKKSLAKAPRSSASAHLEIARIYEEKLDKPGEALKHYQAYLDKNLNVSNAAEVMAKVGELRERVAAKPTPEKVPRDGLKEATELIEKKDFAGALELLREAANESPESEPVHELLAEAYMGSGDLMGAEKEYEWLKAKQVDFAYDKELLVAYCKQGDSYLGKGDYGKAEEKFSKAVELDPDNGELRWKLATAFAGRGEFQRALSEATKVRTMFPGEVGEGQMADLYLRYARSILRQGQFERALEAFKEAKSLNPDLDLSSDMADFCERRARYYQRNGKLVSAEKDYLRALKLEPNRGQVYKELALIYEQMGQYDKALREFEKAANKNRDDASVYKEMAKIYETYKGDGAQAITYYRRYLKGNPDAKDASEIREKFKDAEREKKQITEYKRAIKRRPKHATTHYNLAVLLQRQGKLKEAVGEYRKAIAIEPDNAQAHFNLGYSYDRLKIYDKAIDEYRKAIQYNPDYVKAYNNLAAVYKEKGWRGKAIASFNKALEVDPSYAQAHLGLGSIYADELQDKKKAIYHYRSYLRLQPNGMYSSQVRSWLKGAR